MHLAWVSSAEAQHFVDVANKVTESIKSQGPLKADELQMQLSAAEMTVNEEAVRWLVGKEITITSKGDVYGRKWDVNRYEAFLDSALEKVYHKNLICLAIKADFTSVREISKKTGLILQRVSYLLADLEKTNMVEFMGMQDSKPVFAVI